ncbi:DUF202 domain-containing protein [Lactobacillus acetotolerans]|uniref:DUF202 domain-containing protein n=1 Tax=Lactobacillus acetotolerans TaxID=1600 RepID=UPI0019CF9D12|nr:DUF202 domain-containing protein [Lactobacillus acetotolerans]MBN7276119.1 DUF202 domain-containing protein [Lactobacillus acetotolerans]
MTIEELRKGYMNEVKYQKHMLRNLQYWFQLFLTISAIGVVLIYYYHAKTTWLFVIGIILFVIGALGMLLFGYGQWRGRKNVNLVIDDYQKKIDHIDKEMEKVKK